MNDNLSNLPQTGLVGTETLQAYSVNTDQIQDGSVTAAKIGNLSWDVGQGGTLSLGGANNVNGVLSVKDSSGTEKVRADNTGITVNNGKITIKNSGGTTVLDGTGLVSSANFANNSLFDNSLRSTSSAANSDISNTSLTFSLSRTTNVLVSAVVSAQFDGMGSGSSSGNVPMNVDGVNESFPMTMTDTRLYDGVSSGTSSRRLTMAYQQIKSLAAGSHTIKLQFNMTTSAGGTFGIYQTSIMYVVLGS